MADDTRNITLTFEDGSTHQYQNVPKSVTPDQVEQRASKEFTGKKLKGISGDASPITPTPQPIPQPTQTKGLPNDLLGQKQYEAKQNAYLEPIKKGFGLGAEEMGIAGKQLMSGFKSTPEQAARLKEIEQEVGKLPVRGKISRYAPETLALAPTALAVPEIATAGGLAATLGIGGLGASVARPVRKEAEGGEFGKEKLKEAKQGATEAALGLGLGSALSAVPGALRAVGRGLVGTTQPEITQLASKAEKMGFELEPAQLKKDKPLGSPGFTEASKIKNENLATRLASKETGEATENITPPFVKNRMSDLGEKYNQIFNRKFTIDQDLVNNLQKMKEFELAVDPAAVGPIKTTANNIIDRWNDELIVAQQKQIQARIRQMIGQQGRGGVAPITRLRKDWPTIREASSAGAPEWAGNIETIIKDLSNNLGLKQTPQVWISTPRRPGLFGMATGDGHIVINDTLNGEGALATALHEFGHQAEFQLFAHASPETQADVIRSFREQMASIPLGVKTVEQHRPITSQKYGEQNRTSVPDKGFEKGYLRDFSEWFAEQTSRWITQTKAPTNTVERFFKDVADSWKKIYQKVTGYIPMTSEVDKFFRSNWKGDLINEAVADSGIAKSAEPVALEGVTARIDGKELQRLRSNMQRIARTARDGEDRKAAGEFVQAIDEAIGRHDTPLLNQLRQTNRQYAATSALAEGIEKGYVSGGKISLQGLGENLANKVYGFGSGTSQHPLYDLGYMGRALNLRSRQEGVQFPSTDAMSVLMGRGRQLLSGAVLGRSQYARNLQRKLSEGEQ